MRQFPEWPLLRFSCPCLVCVFVCVCVREREREGEREIFFVTESKQCPRDVIILGK